MISTPVSALNKIRLLDGVAKTHLKPNDRYEHLHFHVHHSSPLCRWTVEPYSFFFLASFYPCGLRFISFRIRDPDQKPSGIPPLLLVTGRGGKTPLQRCFTRILAHGGDLLGRFHNLNASGPRENVELSWLRWDFFPGKNNGKKTVLRERSLISHLGKREIIDSKVPAKKGIC